MLVQRVEALEKKTEGDFIYPHYGQSCISEIPNMILRLFEARNQKTSSYLENLTLPEGINKAVLLVIDGFGFSQFVNHLKENQFLTNLVDKGEVHCLTSVFPSQTTNALTTLNTGLTPQEHGLFEYFIYLKEIGVVNALRFERLGSSLKDRLIDGGFDPSMLLLDDRTIHSTLKHEGIKTFTHMSAFNAFNVLSELMFRESRIISSEKTSDTIVNLRKNLEENNGNNAYFFVHLDTLDTIAHEYGPDSYEYSAELSSITSLLNRELVQKLETKTAKETLLLVTADHGGLNVEPRETTYLNCYPKAILNMQVGRNRKTIFPLGGPRELFLHVKEEKLAETKEWLMQKVGGRAQIIETKEAAARGLFGLGVPDAEFFRRTGNLLILPYGKETVWFADSGGGKISFLGQHGGLSEEEMLVPLSITKIDDLRK